MQARGNGVPTYTYHHCQSINQVSMPVVAIYIIFMSSIMSSITAASSSSSSLAIATRLHLGQSSQPPPTSQLHKTLSSFAQVASTIGATHAVVAVDSEEKLEGYDLLAEVSKICQSLNDNTGNADNDNSSETCTSSSAHTTTKIHVLPVTPWGKFVPALNAIVSWCANHKCQYLLFASAEVQLTQEVMNVMISKMDIERTLVVGTVLSGHEYEQPINNEGEIEVELTGRTTPWNTCALWNLPKLALTGFLLVSEGLHPEQEEGISSAGVEEVVAIATLQRILQPCNAQAKLVSIPGTSWGIQDFNNDEKRKEWHEKKMQSKLTRAKCQLDLLGLSGTVIHC